MSRPALESVPEGASVPAEAATPAERETHLLIVEDDPNVLELYGLFLEDAASLGPEGVATIIHTATSGESALATVAALAAEGKRVACGLFDVYMPGGIDGIETIRRLWEMDSEVQCTLVTGAGSAVEKEIAGRLPSNLLDRWDYLGKPFTQFELLLRVRRAISIWIGRRREERAAGENLRLVLRLARINSELEETVRERTRALEARNEEQQRQNRELATALHQLEAAQSQLLQQEKMASIGQLAAGVAHELNNPIGYVHSNLGTLNRYFEKIRALIDFLGKRQPAEGEAELAELRSKLKVDFLLEDLPNLISESLEGTERVRKIVSDLKVFSHPAENEPRFADLNEGLRSTLNIVHNELKYKATVVTEFADIPPVRCVAGQINQVFMNILVNAAQAIQERGEIRVATRAEGGDVLVDISDTGCGIPPEYLTCVFDPFFTTKEVGKGTGLGLSISLDIVRRHGGELSVRSEVGKGTSFTIRLPVEGGGELRAAK
ncbi:MAG: ATP-binding protein [Planctomycetota bacterium]